MEGQYLLVYLGLCCAVALADLNVGKSTIDTKLKKGLSIFNVVTFPNDVCVGNNNKNGTCYTTEECSNRAGVANGNCADGYGVCCIISLACGGASAENCTYIEMSPTTSPPFSCTYKICPLGNNICRMRYDFMKFDISSPTRGEVFANNINPATANGGAIGDCVSDVFTVTSGGLSGSPQICGENTGQHIFVDVANGLCSNSHFSFDQSLGTSRSYSIKVTQYDCQDEMGGPPGCLQYFTATSGTISSFNFPREATTGVAINAAKATHLSGQSYSMCFRRADNFCYICYRPTVLDTLVDATIDASNSYGIGALIGVDVGGNANVKSITGSYCSTDYLVIRNAVNAVPTDVKSVAISVDRICGRVFYAGNGKKVSDAYTATSSVCTSARPFRVTFVSDQSEFSAKAKAASNTNEWPGGIVGFSLNYKQFPC